MSKISVTNGRRQIIIHDNEKKGYSRKNANSKKQGNAAFSFKSGELKSENDYWISRLGMRKYIGVVKASVLVILYYAPNLLIE
jgi:hypothetical protein